MPPITRQQLKKSYFKTEPYSKENLSEKRTVLLDCSNNDFKTKSTNDHSVKKSKEKFIKNVNITKTGNASRVTTKDTQIKSETFKSIIPINTETQSIKKIVTRSSLNSSKNSTLYQSANEEITNSILSEKCEESYETAIDNTQSSSLHENNYSESYHSAVLELSVNYDEESTFEIDQTNWNSFMYVGCYAREIFNYLRQREDQFVVSDYITNQSEITPKHRAIVVNWLVNLQEMYGLNHEVLYMAVKLIDLYLMNNETLKSSFQLLAASALLLSNKIDVREPGFPYDLVKQSKYIFTEEELIMTERELARALNFDINIPLSYVFLRRFARCMKCQMNLLTLARYILECSLLEYKFVTKKDSLKAAAALFLAFKMFSKSVNNKEFKKCTGYYVREIKDTVIALNNMLHTQSPDLSAVKQKYMHEAFYKVASKSLLSNSKIAFN